MSPLLPDWGRQGLNLRVSINNKMMTISWVINSMFCNGRPWQVFYHNKHSILSIIPQELFDLCHMWSDFLNVWLIFIIAHAPIFAGGYLSQKINHRKYLFFMYSYINRECAPGSKNVFRFRLHPISTGQIVTSRFGSVFYFDGLSLALFWPIGPKILWMDIDLIFDRNI